VAVSLSTFLLIAFGGDDIRATSCAMLDGGSMPVIERRHGDTWWPLVTWDDVRLDPEKAEAYAAACIDTVRQEATKKTA
jgi:hypothetical protein